jgi:hypothetical protein
MNASTSKDRTGFERHVHELACKRFGIKEDASDDELVYWFMGTGDAQRFKRDVTRYVRSDVEFIEVGTRLEGVKVKIPRDLG